ncbi:SNW/SKI-interacting protein-like [Papaver somniferum]|uniref:SNW/SKI-interacting protein-like n=1 Tax=Papaver somniferum TaxID=3469 RepID=UPI000E705C3A|nr:SNW/SKI-interacting protein-like [Papaver somniferum]
MRLQKEIEETTRRTKAALEKISKEQPSDFNSRSKERIVSPPFDPVQPIKFKRTGSPPLPVMHSPPRPLTVKDYQDYKIPPCVSNWKNPKGYTIPLDKRLAADGRGLQEVPINDNFAKLTEALCVAEQKARESVDMRAKVQKEMLLKEQQRKEQALASERAGGATPPPSPSSVCMTSTSDGITSDGGDLDTRGDYEKVKEKDRELPRESREERRGERKARQASKPLALILLEPGVAATTKIQAASAPTRKISNSTSISSIAKPGCGDRSGN